MSVLVTSIKHIGQEGEGWVSPAFSPSLGGSFPRDKGTELSCLPHYHHFAVCRGLSPPPQPPKAHVADARLYLSGKAPGLTHEITIVQGPGRGGVYSEDRSIYVLGVEPPSVSLLPRRDEYTRVYTTVYPRVHNSIHACIQHRSKYILCRARLYVYSSGIIPSIFRDGLGLPRI